MTSLWCYRRAIRPCWERAGDTLSSGQRVFFPDAMSAEDNVVLLAEDRECTRNWEDFKKDGFFQYSAAWDSKHIVEVESGKTARLLFSMFQF